MKILHIGQMIGGLDVYIRNTITYASDSLDFVIACGKDDEHKLVERHGKPVKEYRISLYRTINPLHDIKAIIESIRIIWKEKPDIIHCHSAKGGVVGRIAGFLTGTKTFYTPHAFSYFSTPNRIKKMAYLLVEKMCRLNSRLLACSESEKESGMKVVGYNAKRAYCWHNSVPNTNGLNNIAPPTHISKNQYISYIGRPCYQKNTLFLIDVVKLVHERHPEIKFRLLGVGYYHPLLEEVKQKITDCHLESVVEMLPWLSHDETMIHVDESLFYLTVSRYEGLPLAVLEAMSLGKAIVASNVTGNIDCIKDGYNGILVDIDNPRNMSDAVCRMIEDKELRECCGRNSRMLFENEFTIEKRIHLLEEIYKKI